MALCPLCQHDKQPREAIRYTAAAIERKVPLPGARDEALALRAIFGEQAFPQLDIERIIGSEEMKESRMLRRVSDEGELAAKRADILEALEARFGTPAVTELAPAVNELAELERATRLLRLA